MRNLIFVLCLAVVAGVAYAAQTPMTAALPLPTPPDLSARLTRGGVLVAGGGTAIDCSAAVASSALLNPWSRYYVNCTAPMNIRRGKTAAVALAAATGDLILPANTWLDFPTDGEDFYLGVKNVSGAGVCALQEVK